MEPTLAKVATQQYLILSVAGDRYAVRIQQVREIIPHKGLIQLTGVPPWISAISRPHSGMLPVVDLAEKFGRPARPSAQTSCVVIVDLDSVDQFQAFGIVADHVHQVIDLRDDDLASPPPFGTQVRVDFLLGMGKLGKDIVLVLDVDGVLSQDELRAAAAAIETAATKASGASGA